MVLVAHLWWHGMLLKEAILVFNGCIIEHPTWTQLKYITVFIKLCLHIESNIIW